MANRFGEAGDNGTLLEGSTTEVKHKLIQHLSLLAERITTDSVAAPTPIQNSSLTQSNDHEFHPFPRLAAELRLKIWALSLPRSHILHVNYRHDRQSRATWRNSYVISNGTFGTWTFENKNKPFTNLSVCQESRYQALQSRFFLDFERIHLHRNITERAWFNFKTDTYFLNTPPSRDIVHVYGPYSPLCPSAEQKLRFLAINVRLWNDKWRFSEDFGTDVTCEGCPGYGEDTSQYDFRKGILHPLRRVEKIFFDQSKEHVGSNENLKCYRLSSAWHTENQNTLKDLKAMCQWYGDVIYKNRDSGLSRVLFYSGKLNSMYSKQTVGLPGKDGKGGSAD